MLRSHWYTVGFFRFGSMPPAGGAVSELCTAGDTNEPGRAVGWGRLVGKPWPMRAVAPAGIGQKVELLEATGPPEVSLIETVQAALLPGTRPRMGTSWKVEIVSNDMPKPARTTIFPLPNGSHAAPTRGRKPKPFCRCQKWSFGMKVMGPVCEKRLTGLSGARIRLRASVPGGLYSY